MRVAAVALAHLLDGLGEQTLAVEDVGVFGKEAKNQARHEVVHVGAALGPGPVRVFIQQLDVELVQPPGGAHVNGVVLDLLDGGDAGQRQEEAEMIGEIWIGTSDGFTRDQLFRFERLTIGGEDELGLDLGGGRAGAQCLEGVAHSACCAHGDVDIVTLKHAARYIGGVVVAATQALESCVFVAESGQERERELFPLKRLER